MFSSSGLVSHDSEPRSSFLVDISLICSPGICPFTWERETRWTFCYISMGPAFSLDVSKFLHDVGANKEKECPRVGLHSCSVKRRTEKCPLCTSMFCTRLPGGLAHGLCFHQALAASLGSHRPVPAVHKALPVRDPAPWPGAETFSSALRACSA